MSWRYLGCLFPLALAVGCGGAKPKADAPAAAASNDSGAAEEAAGRPAEGSAESASAEAVPKDCHKPGSVCLPEPKFVKRLCNKRHPGMALHLFGNGSPWTRGYLTRKTEAWNASGGASSGGYLEFDEEVLLLFERRADAGGMQVSGAGSSYDALRWDGSCVTLSGEEVTLQKPPSAKATSIEWRFLDDNVQEALRKDAAINTAYLERRKECQGAVTGDVSLKCVKADAKLSTSIVQHVRGGGAVPVPSTLPE